MQAGGSCWKESLPAVFDVISCVFMRHASSWEPRDGPGQASSGPAPYEARSMGGEAGLVPPVGIVRLASSRQGAPAHARRSRPSGLI